jgi:hypothetical protein
MAIYKTELVGGFFSPNSLVLMHDSHEIPLAAVRPGMHILTLSGDVSCVTKVYRELYDGPIVTIRYADKEVMLPASNYLLSPVNQFENLIIRADQVDYGTHVAVPRKVPSLHKHLCTTRTVKGVSTGKLRGQLMSIDVSQDSGLFIDGVGVSESFPYELE